MSEPAAHDFDGRVLDLHLGHLSRDERAALDTAFESDPDLAQQNESLGAVFSALAAEPAAPLPDDLVARTVARVKAAGAPPRVVRPTDALKRTLEARPERVIRLGNLRDVIAIAALIVLAVGIGVPSMLHMRERAQRVGCSRNLAALGFATQQYASVYNASLPYAGWSTASNSWRPSDTPGVVHMPNRRHIYPLLRRAYVADPRLFICPSQDHVPMPVAAVKGHDDFLEGRNVSYAYQNMAGVRPSLNDDPDLPILADDTPLFADGLPLIDARRLTRGDPARQNSRAHRGAGQNILTLGGHVKWVTTPLSGIAGDNIWTLQGVDEYTGHEGPSARTDAHLIK
jgi:hypothetical protein